MNYIGIRGHRGAGKQTIAYLLGETIDYILSKKKTAEKKKEYIESIKMIKLQLMKKSVVNNLLNYLKSGAIIFSNMKKLSTR